VSADELLGRLPAGSVLRRGVTAEDLERVGAASVRRGVHTWQTNDAPRVARTAAESEGLDSFCGWLAGYGFNIIGSVTFTDKYAVSRNLFQLERAIKDVQKGLVQVPCPESNGYPGRYVACGEWNPSGRLVPHVHLALECPVGVDVSLMCSVLWRFFVNTRGRSRFEPMRDVSRATLYGLKDTIKAGSADPRSMALVLHRPRRRGRHSK